MGCTNLKQKIASWGLVCGGMIALNRFSGNNRPEGDRRFIFARIQPIGSQYLPAGIFRAVSAKKSEINNAKKR
jgi:hypothetical protein